MRARRARTSIGLSSALSLVLTMASGRPAHANGRFPAAQHVLVGPGRAERTIALRATFGFVVSDDSGASFHWICEDALDYPGSEFDPGYALDRAGRLHVGLIDGLIRASLDRCEYVRDRTADGVFVVDLAQSPAGDVIVAATGSGSTSFRNRIYRSDDGGETFRIVGEGPAGVAFDTIEIAPSDTRRIYLTARTIAGQEPVFFRSDDGGATLRTLALPAGNINAAFVSGVDPHVPDTLYVRAEIAPSTMDPDAGTWSTALLRSDDGGASWREIGRTRGAMLGFALSDDGRRVWYGGPNAFDGLLRSDDGGASFARVNDIGVLCLRFHAGALYVCADDVLAGFALGRSHDRGTTIEPLLRLRDLAGPFACPAGSPERDYCGARWPALRARLPGVDGGRIDAGRDAGEGESTGACRCNVPGHAARRTGSVSALFGAIVYALSSRCRQRARTAPARRASAVV